MFAASLCGFRQFQKVPRHVRIVGERLDRSLVELYLGVLSVVAFVAPVRVMDFLALVPMMSVPSNDDRFADVAIESPVRSLVIHLRPETCAPTNLTDERQDCLQARSIMDRQYHFEIA